MNIFEIFEQNKELSFMDALKDFLPLVVDHLELDKLPKIKLQKSISDSHIPTFGQYVNNQHCIHLNIANRHPVDILRTLAHELVHFKQDLNNQLENDSWKTGSPEENDANSEAGIIMRNFNTEYPKYLSLKPIIFKSTEDEERW